MRKPKLNVITGVLLIAAGIMEGSDTVLEEFAGIELKGHYSIMLIGLFHLADAGIEILEGMTTIEEDPGRNEPSTPT